MFARSWRIPTSPAFAVGCWGGGEEEGRPHGMVMTIIMAIVWAKKGLDKGIGEGELKDGFVLSCCPILILFFGLPFSMQFVRLISYQDQVNCWTGFTYKISLPVVQTWMSIDYSSSSSWLFIAYLLQDFSSSHPNLVITFLFGNYSVRVNCCK